MYAIMAAMIGKIDKFGRIAIPKSVRDRLGLNAETPVEIKEEDGQIRIALASEVPPIRRAKDGLLVLWVDPASIALDPVRASREARLSELLGSQRP